MYAIVKNVKVGTVKEGWPFVEEMQKFIGKRLRFKIDCFWKTGPYAHKTRDGLTYLFHRSWLRFP